MSGEEQVADVKLEL